MTDKMPTRSFSGASNVQRTNDDDKFDDRLAQVEDQVKGWSLRAVIHREDDLKEVYKALSASVICAKI